VTARVRRHLWISGRVQGVFFRDRCRQEANHQGVEGFVRNLADGRVEVVLEGPPEAVAAVEAWCAHGPPRAGVERVDGRDEEPTGVTGFGLA
jgi:acylphosphatase